MSDTIHSCSPFCTLSACVKERQRRDFEEWMLYTEKIIVGSSDPYPAGLERERWRVWQAATKSATALERERCVSAIKRESDKTVSIAVFCGVEAVDLRPYEICEAAIRQGGDT